MHSIYTYSRWVAGSARGRLVQKGRLRLHSALSLSSVRCLSLPAGGTVGVSMVETEEERERERGSEHGGVGGGEKEEGVKRGCGRRTSQGETAGCWWCSLRL